MILKINFYGGIIFIIIIIGFIVIEFFIYVL